MSTFGYFEWSGYPQFRVENLERPLNPEACLAGVCVCVIAVWSGRQCSVRPCFVGDDRVKATSIRAVFILVSSNRIDI